MKSKHKVSSAKCKYLLLLCLINLCACKKLVEVPAPATSINGANVYENTSTATAVILGIYTNMSFGGNITSIPEWLGLSGDELRLHKTDDPLLSAIAINSQSPIKTVGLWDDFYNKIFTANAAMEGINSSSGLPTSVKTQLLGETYFIRAFCYFYLVNIYGDVPLALTSDYKINAVLARSSRSSVYQQIISDLKRAQTLLKTNFVGADGISATIERIRPTQWAATALLARVYLYAKDYKNADIQASLVIANSTQFSLEPLNQVFKKNSNEAIWQLQSLGTSDNNNANTAEGAIFVINPSADPSVFLSNTQLNSFEPGDLRKTVWVAYTGGYPYVAKYRIGNFGNFPTTEYSMMLRLGEQYLIRAEAKIQNGDIPGGIADLNFIRNRATDLTAIPANKLPQISSNISAILAMKAVEHERQVELFCEGGNRWFDIIRLGRADDVFGVKNPATWQTTDQLYPIPLLSVLQDHNMVQNPGY